MTVSTQTPTWIFGYGSLMWNPGFPFITKQPARLDGYRRRPCVSSVHYRGSLSSPGVVMGLDKSPDSCQGIGYQIAAQDFANVIAYLDQRELIYPVYRRVERMIHLTDTDPQPVQAITYLVDRQDPLYIGDLDSACLVTRVAHAAGVSGTSRAYLSDVIDHLRALQIHDEGLEQLLAAVHQAGPSCL
jgi:cation transport protein ChaC